MDTSVIKASHIKRMRWVFFPSENLWWPCLLYSSAPALIQDIPNSSNMQLKIKIFLCAKELANPTQPVALLLGARPPKRVVEVRDEHLKDFMDEYFSLSDQRCPDDNWKTRMDQAVAFSVEWAKKASEMYRMDDESYDDSVVSFQDTVAINSWNFRTRCSQRIGNFIINALIRCGDKHRIVIERTVVVIPTCSVNCLLVLLSLGSNVSKYVA